MIALIFDPHIWNHRRHGGTLVRGINRRGALCLDVLRRAVDVANQHSAPLVVAGDLVDSAGPVQPQLAAALRNTLAGCHNGAHLMLGNHDMTSEGDHSLAVYEGPNFVVEGHPIKVKADIAFVHDEWLRELACLVPFHCDIRDERVREVPLLVAHFGVYDDSFPAWCKKAKGAWRVDALFAHMRERNIKVACLGDWHTRRVWFGRGGKNFGESYQWTEHNDVWPHDDYVIMQGGALCPTGHDNSGLYGYGTVALWDPNNQRLSWQELPGPRFCTMRSDEEQTAIVAEARRLGHALFLRRFYEGDPPQRPDGVEAFEALPLKVERAAQATAWRVGHDDNASSIERQISEWLDRFGDDREALEAHVRRYL